MVMKPGIELSEGEKNGLRKGIATVKDNKSFRAMTGVLLRSEGHPAQSVAKNLGVSQKQVFVWCKSYKDRGMNGLQLRKPPGRTAREGDKAKKRIPDLLKKDPQLFGFLKGRWVLRDISKELKKEGINLSYQSVGRVLGDLGIPLVRPKLRAPGSLKKNYAKRREIKNYKMTASALQKRGSL